MPPSKKQRQRLLQTITTHIANTPDLMHMVANSYNIDQRHRAEFISSVVTTFPEASQITDLFSQITTFVGNNPAENGPLLVLYRVLRKAKEEKVKLDTLKRQFSYDMGFSQSPKDREDSLCYIQKCILPELHQPYPLPKHWIYESQIIHDLWYSKLQTEKQPDSRLPRLPMHLIDLNLLQVDISETESKIFYDASTNEIIGLVIRNWMPRTWLETVQWVDEIVVDGCTRKKSIRLEDPGTIAQVGFSGGSRSKPSFDWTRNLLSKKHTAESLSTFDYSCSSVFALLWNMCSNRLSRPVIDDFNNYLETTKIARMQNVSNPGGCTLANYTVKANGEYIQYRAVEMAPPVGFFGMNYARGIHNESCPHKYAIFWTTSRTFETNEGGHFFISNYGIRIQGAANTLVVWKPKNWHGTSLSAKGPNNDAITYRQSGLSIVTPNRLTKVWGKYMQSQLTALEVEDEIMESGSDLGDDTE